MHRCQFMLCSFSENWNLDICRREEWNWWIIRREKKMKYIFVSLSSIIPSAWSVNVLITEISKPNHSLRGQLCSYSGQYTSHLELQCTEHTGCLWDSVTVREHPNYNVKAIKSLTWFMWSNWTAYPFSCLLFIKKMPGSPWTQNTPSKNYQMQHFTEMHV